MTERKVTVGKLMAAASVLGLSLGMTAQAADTNQIKGETTQIKGETTQIKGETTQIKGETNQHKWTGFLKHHTDHKISTQHKIGTGDSTQIKLDDGLSAQHKHDIPSSELNPQPEPPKPIQGTEGSSPH